MKNPPELAIAISHLRRNYPTKNFRKSLRRLALVLFLLPFGGKILLFAQGSIGGPSVVCVPLSGVQYVVNGSSASTGYSWTVPSGATITSGAGTKTITVSFAVGSAGLGRTIAVSGNGLNAAMTLNLYALPSAPSITGPMTVTVGQTYSYSINALPNATGYSWTAPSNATIASGQGTTSVTISFSTSFTSGSIVARGIGGACGAGPTSSFVVTAQGAVFPAQAGPISGPGGFCLGSSGATMSYSVAPIANATSYLWSVSGGATGSSTSSTINVFFPPDIEGSSMTVTVQGVNATGAGAPSTRTIPFFKPTGARGPITGPTLVCENQSYALYSIDPVPNAVNYLWFVSDGATMLYSNGSTSMGVKFSSFNGGTIGVVPLAGPCPGSSSVTLTLSTNLPSIG